MKTNKSNRFKKSVLSIVIISAITGSLISWDRYQPRHETTSMTEFYQHREFDREADFVQSFTRSDSETLAQVAENNLLEVSDLVESVHFPDADGSYDLLELEQLADLQKEDIGAKEFVAFDDERSTENTLVKEALIKNNLIKSTVLFAFNSSEINPDYYELLNATAQSMQSRNDSSKTLWQVVGYADLSGNFNYNTRLAKKRAKSVALYLLDKGVNEDQLSVVSLGASDPLYSERSVKNNQFERRVEVHAYQPEVTALVTQLNKFVNRPVNTSKLIIIPSVAPKQVDISESQQGLASVDFNSIHTEQLTTAMEF